MARRPRRFPSPSPGVPGAMGIVRQPVSGCAPARRQRRAPGAQPAPGTGVRHYLALRLSLDWSDSAAPIPSLLRRATDTHSGRLLKGDDAPFPCRGSALGSPRGIPDSLASASLPFPRSPVLKSKALCMPSAVSAGCPGLGGVIEPQFLGTLLPETCPRVGGSECDSHVPKSFSPGLQLSPSFPS